MRCLAWIVYLGIAVVGAVVTIAALFAVIVLCIRCRHGGLQEKPAEAEYDTYQYADPTKEPAEAEYDTYQYADSNLRWQFHWSSGLRLVFNIV